MIWAIAASRSSAFVAFVSTVTEPVLVPVVPPVFVPPVLEPSICTPESSSPQEAATVAAPAPMTAAARTAIHCLPANLTSGKG